jgi:hypothetical protein
LIRGVGLIGRVGLLCRVRLVAIGDLVRLIGRGVGLLVGLTGNYEDALGIVVVGHESHTRRGEREAHRDA